MAVLSLVLRCTAARIEILHGSMRASSIVSPRGKKGRFIMVTATAKPAKLTEALIDEYMLEQQKADEAKAALKTLVDKANSLYEQIEAAFLKLGKDKKKVGRFVLSLLRKRGNVQWKAELMKRINSEQLKAIQDATEEKVEVDIKEA